MERIANFYGYDIFKPNKKNGAKRTEFIKRSNRYDV